MNKPTTAITKQYYFVKDEVIFEINASNPDNDTCAKSVDEDKLPYLDVTDVEASSTTKYYLDIYIQDGDKYNDELGFTKTGHDSEEHEAGMTYTEYFLQLCKKQIKNVIISKKNYTYDYFKNNLSELGIPLYAIKDNGYTVEDKVGMVDLIDFTEDLFNELKKEGVIEAALKVANDKAKTFGYKVLNATLDVEKIED